MAGQGVEIPIVAKLSGFDAAFQKLASQAASATARIRSSLNGLGGVLSGLGATVSVGGLTLFVKSAIDAADHLNDLSKRTGVAVETLGGIGFAAEQAGASLDEAAAAFGKFNLNIAKAAAGDKEAARAFQLLGISIKDLQSLTSDQLLIKAADAFAGFDDGPNKAALANAAFGKSYAGLLPLLDEGGESLRKSIDYYRRYGGVTAEAAKAADEFNDTLGKLKLLNQQYARSLASELLPSLQAIADQMVETGEKSDAFKRRAEETASILKAVAVFALYTQSHFRALAESIGAAAAAQAAFLSGDFSRAKSINDDFFERNKQRLEELAKMRDAILNGAPPKTAGANTASGSGGRGGRRPAPSLGTGDTDQAERKALEAHLRSLDAFIKDEQDILRDREHFLAAYYQDDKIGIEEYFSTRQSIILDALNAQRAAFDEQERALRASLAKTTEPDKRIEIEAKITDVVNKRADAERDAAGKTADGFIESTRAADAFVRSIEQVSIELAELRGDSVVAGLARFDLGNADLRKKLEANVASADEAIARQANIGLRSLETQRSILASQLSLNAATRDFGLIVEQVGIKQQSVSIAAANGYLTEIEALQKLSDINRSRLDDLAKEIDLATQAAQGLVEKMGADSPEAQAALNFVDQLKLKYQELAQTGDLVAKSFNQIGAGSLSQLFKDIAGGKNALESLKAAAENLVQTSFGKIADSAAQTLFNQGGIFSGFGEAISKLLGTAHQATGAAALATAGTSLTAAGTAITGSVTVLTTAGSSLTVAAGALSSAAAALTAAAAAQSAGTAGDAFGQAAGAFFGSSGAGGSAFVGPSLGYAANGAEYTNGGAYIVGESGRELLIPPKGSRIVPNHRLADYNGGQTMIVNQVINVPPGANTASYAQAARQANRQLAAERLR